VSNMSLEPMPFLPLDFAVNNPPFHKHKALFLVKAHAHLIFDSGSVKSKERRHHRQDNEVRLHIFVTLDGTRSTRRLRCLATG
jgi:hypothetical protein